MTCPGACTPGQSRYGGPPPHIPACRTVLTQVLIVTSRLGDREAWPLWITVTPVGPLPTPPAGEQLRLHGGATAGTSKEADHLANRLGGHPLTLHPRNATRAR
jgi:hypothetical protein